MSSTTPRVTKVSDSIRKRQEELTVANRHSTPASAVVSGPVRGTRTVTAIKSQFDTTPTRDTPVHPSYKNFVSESQILGTGSCASVTRPVPGPVPFPNAVYAAKIDLAHRLLTLSLGIPPSALDRTADRVYGNATQNVGDPPTRSLGKLSPPRDCVGIGVRVALQHRPHLPYYDYKFHGPLRCRLREIVIGGLRAAPSGRQQEYEREKGNDKVYMSGSFNIAKAFAHGYNNATPWDTFHDPLTNTDHRYVVVLQVLVRPGHEMWTCPSLAPGDGWPLQYGQSCAYPQDVFIIRLLVCFE